jgi:hypothetical protein
MLPLVHPAHRDGAEQMRSLISSNQATPAVFRTALTSIPPPERDAWVDLVLGLDEIPEDGPDLPSGCVPRALLRDTLSNGGARGRSRRTCSWTSVRVSAGRAALTHFLTSLGHRAQVQSGSSARRDLTNSLRNAGFRGEGDAARLTGFITIGSVYFPVLPLQRRTPERVLHDLESIARAADQGLLRRLALPPCSWLEPVAPISGVAVYRSS